MAVIVVGVDGSEPSKAALRWALAEARSSRFCRTTTFPLLSPKETMRALYAAKRLITRKRNVLGKTSRRTVAPASTREWTKAPPARRIYSAQTPEQLVPAIPRIEDPRRHAEAHGLERLEICEVVPTVHGDVIAQVLATATTARGARLAVQTIQRECGIDLSRIRIYDTLRRCWLGPHRLEQREEP